MPIFALTPHKKTCRRVSIYRGVYPILLDKALTNPKEANREAIESLCARGEIENGDLVIVTKGDLVGIHGGTNMLKMITVGEDLGSY
jgi:pyruvate kinase